MQRLFYHAESDSYFWGEQQNLWLTEGHCEDVTDDAGHRAEAMFAGVVPPPLFEPLPEGPYDVILADPAWNYITYAGSGAPARGKQPYGTVTLSDLMKLPVQSIAAPDCALVMWYLGSHLEQALALGKAWGFTYKTDLLDWVKVGKHDPDVRPISMGHWTRKQTEKALLFSRGRPARLDKGVRQLIEAEEHVIFAPKREHSRKPDEQYDRLERLIEAERRVELFARFPRAGWDGWGDQYPKEDQYGGL